MTMKALKSVSLGLILMGSTLAVHAAGDTATVTITGTVTNASCTLVQPSPVVLSPVDVRDFGGKANTILGQGTVEIKLTNCTSDQSGLGIKVSGENDAAGPTIFKNTEKNSPATGVGIEVIDTNGTAFKTDGSSKASPQTKASDGSYDIKYTAKYISTSDTVTAGKVKSVITVAFTYS